MGQFYSKDKKDLLASIHKLNCVLTDVEAFKDNEVVLEYVIERQQRNDFHLKRGADYSGCATLVCRLCGNDKFIVGQSHYFTALKCDQCGYEVGIHEG